MIIILWICAIDLVLSALLKIAWVGKVRTFDRFDAIGAVIMTAIYVPAIVWAARA